MPGIFAPESDDDDVDSRQLSYADYEVGDYISFKKSPQSPISYAVISKILEDNAPGNRGKSYDIIYCDTGRPDDSLRSNPTTTSGLRENISPFSQTIPVYFRHYDGQFRGLEEVTKIQNPQEIPSEILTELQGAFNTREGTFTTPPVSRSTTGTSYDNSRSSSNSSIGGKRYRKKKNKTKRRNKKTKHRRNRKTKRR
jgi:hypothetical protein